MFQKGSRDQRKAEAYEPACTGEEVGLLMEMLWISCWERLERTKRKRMDDSVRKDELL